jgi:hypothetical protein
MGIWHEQYTGRQNKDVGHVSKIWETLHCVMNTKDEKEKLDL